MSSERTEDSSLARIGAFSDGVFAFAITLLILGGWLGAVVRAQYSRVR